MKVREGQMKFVFYKYIVDFVCYEKKIIIELDGGQHSEHEEKDQIRDE